MNRLQELLQEKEELLIAARRLACSQSFPLFIRKYLPNLTINKPPLFHYEIEDILNQSIKENKTTGGYATPATPIEISTLRGTNFSDKNTKGVDKKNRLLFIAPRGFAKSTICTDFFSLWLSVFGIKKDIFIVSATMALSIERLRKIRTELENNEMILGDFGVQKSDKWTEDHLILKNGVNIRAKGRGFQIRGFRPDIIICDDLEDEESLYSKEQRDKLESWFLRTLMPSLKPDQILVYVGTKLHQLSLMGKLEEKPEFLVKRYKALVDGKSIWEDYFPTETLKNLKNELGIYAFEAEYQNNPLSLEEQPIKPHFIEGVKIKGEQVARCLVIDPAISEKETADYRAIGVFDRLMEKNEQGIVIKDGFSEVVSEHGKWPVMELCDKVIDWYEKFKPDRIILEEVAFQQVLRTVLMERARIKGIFLPITTADLWAAPHHQGKERKRPKDKLTRLMSVAHLFEQRLVELVNPLLIQEILSFPFGDYDDFVDITVYGLFWLMNYRPGFAVKNKEDRKVVQGEKSFYVDEVRPGVFIAKHGDPPIQIKGTSRLFKF